MATQRQIEANRLNAMKSTGPRTEEGKRVSSQNALKSGLDADSLHVFGESLEEFALLQAEYFERFAPTTPEERFHVDQLIRSEWILRRLDRVESQLWNRESSLSERGTGYEMGEAFSRSSSVFMRLQRRVSEAKKTYKESMAELTRLRVVSQPQPQPQQTAEETPELGSFLSSPAEPLAGPAVGAELTSQAPAFPPEGPDSRPGADRALHG